MTQTVTTPAAPTMSHLFIEQVNQKPNQAALHVMQGDTPVAYTWGELADWVWRWTAALARRGVAIGDRVAHWSENRVEWVIMDLAIQACGAVHVPLHATLSGQQAADQIKHSGAIAVVFASKNNAEALAPHAGAIAQALGKAPAWISYAPVQDKRLSGVATIKQLAADLDSDEGRQIFESRVDEMDPMATTSILYSSGTTGEPKGVELTQHNLVSNAWALAHSFGEQPLETRLNFLPFSHIFGRTCDLNSWIVRGSHLALAQKP